jgi:CHAT domain
MTSKQIPPQFTPPMSSEDLHLDVRTVPADLTVEILNPDNDGRTFQVKVTAPLLEEYSSGKSQPWVLGSTAAEVVIEYMRDFTEKSADKEERLASLQGAGIELFEATPRIFKEAFWALLDAGKPPRTIFIASQERSIPWELMIPQRRDEHGSLHPPRDPLGVEFNIGRWQQEHRPFHIQSVPLTNPRVIAPEYQGRQKLEKAKDEADFVCKHFSGALITPAQFNEIDSQLRDWHGTLLHFVCHGAASTAVKQVIWLENTKKLTSTQIGGMKGVAQALDSNKPVVFLNACEVGRPAAGLIGVGGFTKRLTDIGARAVIAPLWSVRDTIAHEVAVEFYKKVIAEPRTPFGEILRQIRAKAYGEDGGEDTYAAYCLYGDPLLSAAPA